MDETTAMGGNTSGATAAANNIEGEPVKVEGSTTAADPDLKKEDAAENVEAATPKGTEDTPASKDESTGAMADTKIDEATPNGTQNPTKETKKRVRRVGRTPTRKIPKLEEKATPSLDTGVSDENNVHVAAAVDAATAAIGAAPVPPETAGTIAIASSSTIAVGPPQTSQGVLSKHDEKWHAMFQKLLEYKERNKHTLVPQCYAEDPRLGRWVHYQRVEYWIFQQKGTAKITEERIARLNSIGFEWDPQKAQWEKMFAKLKEFKKEFSHCRVPKGYDKDWELANWVRNQRLEQANLSKEGKKSRMTPERFKLLNDLGFKWSSPTPARARRNRQVTKKEQKADDSKKSASDVAANPDGADGKAVEAPLAGQDEAVTAATNVVGNLPAANEGGAEESTKLVSQDVVAEESENPVVVV